MDLTASLDFARRTAHRALDLVYPPLCLHCSERLHAGGAAAPHPLCEPCQEDCVRVTYTTCDQCGAPAVSGRSSDPGPCEECRTLPPSFTIARSAFFYHESGPLRSVLLRLKHGGDLTVLSTLADELVTPALIAADNLDQPQLCAVPLHWFRRFRRGFNQAELLARHLGSRIGLEFFSPLVRRVATKPQKGDRAERQAAMRSAFSVPSPSSVAGKDLLLVDDVLTTGATVGACAQTLLEAGARNVGVVTLARVAVNPRD